MIVQAMPYPGALSVDDYFASDGANQPFLGTATHPAAIHSGDMTWISWEAWTGSNRSAQVAGYDHSTGYWTEIEGAGHTPLTDDDHGTPSLCLDDEGYLHCFHGSHNSNQLHSSTRWAVTGSAGTGSLWGIRAPIAGEYTYPHPVLIGSNIFLFLRSRITASSKYTLVLRKTATLAAGEATWDSEITLVDLGTNTRFYMGTIEAVGTDIHVIATKADASDTLRENVYYFVYDTTTGAVRNYDSTTTVASGSLPVSLVQADASFKLFDHSGSNDDGGAPSLCFDTNGDPHVLFKDGTGTSYDVKHITYSGGSWSSPATVATVDNRYNCPVLVPFAGGVVEAWYAADPSAAWDRFGNIARCIRSAAGTWGSEQTMLTAVGEGLGNPSAVRSADTDARVIFSEAIDDATDASAGGLKIYIYGNGGLITYQAEPETPDATTETLQLNAENLQLNGEDLTLGV